MSGYGLITIEATLNTTGPLIAKRTDVLSQDLASLEAAKLDLIMIVCLWSMTGISAAMLPSYLSNFRAISIVRILKSLWCNLKNKPQKNRAYILLDKVHMHTTIGHCLYLLSGRRSHRNISWSLEAARLDVLMIVSRWNATSISAALLPMYLSNFRTIGKV